MTFRPFQVRFRTRQTFIIRAESRSEMPKRRKQNLVRYSKKKKRQTFTEASLNYRRKSTYNSRNTYSNIKTRENRGAATTIQERVYYLYTTLTSI